jgi:hypothetical protein
MSLLTTFIPNPLFDVEISADADTKAVISTLGQTALDGAWNAVHVVTGHARSSYFWDAETQSLGSTSSFWHLDEYGSVNNVGTAPLRRGVEAAGLPWSDAR